MLNILRSLFRRRTATPLKHAIAQLSKHGVCFVEASTASELEKECVRLQLPADFEIRANCRFVRVVLNH